MREVGISNRQKLNGFVCCVICVLLIVLVSGCGNGHHTYSETETGSIAFSVEWQTAPTIEHTEPVQQAAPLDCEAAFVAAVTFEVYDENDSYLAGDSWPCSYHQGTVEGVPAGSNRKLVVLGEDSNDTLLYQGEVTGITVTAGETTDVGSVLIYPVPTINNSLGMTFNLISAGTFTMGSPENELGRDSDETQHQVTISNSYYMQTTEVTQAQWEAVMGSNPSYFSGCADCPVEQVAWDDVQDFITALNAMGEGTYRLPTEAEWEYACRAGSHTALANGDITATGCGYDPNLDEMGWYCYNSGDETHRVAQKDPNAWGLYEMHGNVWEWCQDWYGSYPSESVTDPTGPCSGSYRVSRGGSWSQSVRGCRSADRNDYFTPSDRGYGLGFRLAWTP